MGVSLKEFARSRWAPWSLVVVLLALLSGGGWYGKGLNQELMEQTTLSESLKEQLHQQSFELAQVEWSLRQERNKQTTKTREERRADGTVITEREENAETSTSKSDGTSTVQTEMQTKTDRTQNREESGLRYERTESSLSRYHLGLGANLGLDLKLNYEIIGGIRLGDLPLWLVPSVEVRGDLFVPSRLGLGITWEF
jgi:hypothetical protein